MTHTAREYDDHVAHNTNDRENLGVDPTGDTSLCANAYDIRRVQMT